MPDGALAQNKISLATLQLSVNLPLKYFTSPFLVLTSTGNTSGTLPCMVATSSSSISGTSKSLNLHFQAIANKLSAAGFSHMHDSLCKCANTSVAALLHIHTHTTLYYHYPLYYILRLSPQYLAFFSIAQDLFGQVYMVSL